MTGDQLKAWRSARKISQVDLGRRLGISRESMIRYEASGTDPVPKQLELAICALALGFDAFNGSNIGVNVFKLEDHSFGHVTGPVFETVFSLRHGRSKPYGHRDITMFLKRHDIHVDDDLVFTLNDDLVRELLRDFY